MLRIRRLCAGHRSRRHCGAKHAIQGFHEALRCELLHDHTNLHVTMVQMPAINPPQFSCAVAIVQARAAGASDLSTRVRCARSRVRRRAPGRREYWVGASTAGTLVANAIAPGLLDRYLARTGFKSQQANRRQAPHATANLFEPADGCGGRDFGAHGIFGNESHYHDPQLWVSQHHRALAAAGGVAAGVGAVLGRRTRR